MPQEDNRCGKVDEALKICGVILIPNNHPTEVEKPREEPLDFPPPFVAPQRAAILGRLFPSFAMGRDHLRSKPGSQLFVQYVAIVSFVADQSFRRLGNYPLFKGRLD